jgi:hypothetical protein
MNTTTTISAENCVLVSCLAIGWAVLTITRDFLIPLAGLALALAGWRPAQPPAEAPVSHARVEPSRSLITLEGVLNATPLRVQQRIASRAGLIEITNSELLQLETLPQPSKAERLPADRPFRRRAS